MSSVGHLSMNKKVDECMFPVDSETARKISIQYSISPQIDLTGVKEFRSQPIEVKSRQSAPGLTSRYTYIITI